MSRAIGVEIGGTKLQAGIGDGGGALLALSAPDGGPLPGRRRDPGRAPSLIEEVISKSGTPAKELRGLGVGFGGPVDTSRGRILVSHQIDGWADFPLRDWLRKKVEVPVVLQNDAKTAALAEAREGAGKGLRRSSTSPSAAAWAAGW